MLQDGHRDRPLTKYDVLIVGAGAAGLAAGRLLAEAGKRVMIVEARTRVGGRIWTHHLASTNSAPPFPVELGAEFIHGLPRATWALIEEARLKTIELAGEQRWYAGGRLRAHAPEQRAAHDELERMTQLWITGQWQDRDFTFSEYLQHHVQDSSTAEAAAAYVEGFNAADRNCISVGALARQQQAEDLIEGDRIFHVEAGYDTIPIFLADRFARAGGNLLLARRVREVVWRRGAVALHVDSAAERVVLQACRALITVPLGVLQAGTIGFTPRPEEVLSQAHRLVMGPVVRSTLVFEDRFWAEAHRPGTRGAMTCDLRQLSFLFSPSELPAAWWTPMPRNLPMITGWVGGPKAAAWRRELASPSGSQPLLNQCLTTLAKIFEVPLRELDKRLLSCHAHDWQSDEFTRGAYSYVPAGALDAPRQMAQPVENTLFFAGEHTDTEGHWGTVHAALQTGLRAAHQVLSAAQ